MIKPTPPKNKKELFQRLTDIVQHGTYKMPEKYGGTGAPGVFLEDLLGLTTGNKDIPDSLGWELKFYSPKTALVTLFHKEPQPAKIVRELVTHFGWLDKEGRLSFRHTIAGKSDRFKIERKREKIVVRPLAKSSLQPYWTDDSILNAAGAKLRRLILVRGVRNKQNITYDRIDVFENLQLTYLIHEIVRGTIRIDFDARESKPGSQGLRNHGTKFRIEPDNICRIYSKKERFG